MIFYDILNLQVVPTESPSAHWTGRFAPARCTAVNSVSTPRAWDLRVGKAVAQVPPGDRLAPASRHQTVPRAAHPRSPADRGGPFRRHLRPPGSHLTRGSETGAPRERGLRSYHERYHKQEGAVKAFSKRNPAVSILPISYFSSSDAFCQ